MKKIPRILLLLAAVAGGGALRVASVEGAKRPPQKLEVYSAVEDEDGTSSPEPIQYVLSATQPDPEPEKPKPHPSLHHTHSAKHLAHVAAKAKAKRTPSRKSAPDYDPVPADQTESVAERLDVVETLIREYGRAYDYRSHTLRDLKTILARLEAADPKEAPLPEAPAILDPVLPPDND